MEEILCRFQHLGEQIFAELEDLSLAKSRETSRSWLDFISNEKFYKNRINEMLANKATDYGKLRGELLRSKVHCAAFFGQTQIVMDILEDSSDKNPKNDKLVTPLHLAAEKGFVSICEYTIEKNDSLDKFPKDNRGRTPLHFAALNGHLRSMVL
jgi:ankyrin repeat protein